MGCADPGAECRELTARNRAQSLEQIESCLNRIIRRPVEPFERAWIAARCEDLQQRAREIHPVDLGLPMGLQPVALAPEPHGRTGPQPCGAPRPLIRGVHRNMFQFEAVDRAVRIVTGNFVETRVYDDANTWHRERGLGDVGREDDSPPGGGSERRIRSDAGSAPWSGTTSTPCAARATSGNARPIPGAPARKHRI